MGSRGLESRASPLTCHAGGWRQSGACFSFSIPLPSPRCLFHLTVRQAAKVARSLSPFVCRKRPEPSKPEVWCLLQLLIPIPSSSLAWLSSSSPPVSSPSWLQGTKDSYSPSLLLAPICSFLEFLVSSRTSVLSAFVSTEKDNERTCHLLKSYWMLGTVISHHVQLMSMTTALSQRKSLEKDQVTSPR